MSELKRRIGLWIHGNKKWAKKVLRETKYLSEEDGKLRDIKRKIQAKQVHELMLEIEDIIKEED